MAARSVAGRTPKPRLAATGNVRLMVNGRTGECGLNAVPNVPKPAQDLAQTQPQRMAEKDAVAMSQNSYPVAMANASWMVSGQIGEYGQNVAPNARRQDQGRAVIQHRRMAERHVAGTAKRVYHALAENAQ